MISCLRRSSDFSCSLLCRQPGSRSREQGSVGGGEQESDRGLMTIADLSSALGERVNAARDRLGCWAPGPASGALRRVRALRLARRSRPAGPRRPTICSCYQWPPACTPGGRRPSQVANKHKQGARQRAVSKRTVCVHGCCGLVVVVAVAHGVVVVAVWMRGREFSVTCGLKKDQSHPSCRWTVQCRAGSHAAACPRPRHTRWSVRSTSRRA